MIPAKAPLAGTAAEGGLCAKVIINKARMAGEHIGPGERDAVGVAPGGAGRADEFLNAEKGGVRRIIPRGKGELLFRHEGKKACGDDARARVAPDAAEGSELPKRRPYDAGFFLKFARGRLLELFIHFHKAARQRPAPDVGMVAPLDEQRAEIAARRDENGHIDRRRGAAVAGFVIFSQKRFERAALFIAHLMSASCYFHF